MMVAAMICLVLLTSLAKKELPSLLAHTHDLSGLHVAVVVHMPVRFIDLLIVQ